MDAIRPFPRVLSWGPGTAFCAQYLQTSTGSPALYINYICRHKHVTGPCLRGTLVLRAGSRLYSIVKGRVLILVRSSRWESERDEPSGGGESRIPVMPSLSSSQELAIESQIVRIMRKARESGTGKCATRMGGEAQSALGRRSRAE